MTPERSSTQLPASIVLSERKENEDIRASSASHLPACALSCMEFRILEAQQQREHHVMRLERPVAILPVLP